MGKKIKKYECNTSTFNFPPRLPVSQGPWPIDTCRVSIYDHLSMT